jgi:myotubularin-related protein 6/7/8
MERIRIPKVLTFTSDVSITLAHIYQVEHVVCWRQGKRFEGTLHLTAHHLIFSYPPPSVLESTTKGKHRELWITFPMIAFCTYRPAPPASHQAPSIRLRCRDFVFVAFNFLTEKEARAVYDSIKSLTCKLGRVEKLYAFSYVPQPPEKELNGWNIYEPKKEFARQGISTDKGWRITRINTNYQVFALYHTQLTIYLLFIVFSHLSCCTCRTVDHL